MHIHSVISQSNILCTKFSIYSRNTGKISYCCMKNMGSAISSHNKQMLNPRKEYFGRNCRVRDELPLSNEWLTPNVMYEAKISNETNNECIYWCF